MVKKVYNRNEQALMKVLGEKGMWTCKEKNSSILCEAAPKIQSLNILSSENDAKWIIYSEYQKKKGFSSSPRSQLKYANMIKAIIPSIKNLHPTSYVKLKLNGGRMKLINKQSRDNRPYKLCASFSSSTKSLSVSSKKMC